jgi:hypothetical protein
VSLHLEDDGRPIRVDVEPHLLVELLTALLQLLEADARRPGVVTVRLGTAARRAFVELRNDGFGIPPEALRAALDGPEPPEDGPHRRIRTLRDRLRPAGDLALDADVGRGYRARVDLPVKG